MAPDTTIDREVCGDALEGLERLAEGVGLSRARLYAGYEALGDAGGTERVAWSTFVALLERVADAAGSEDRLAELGATLPVHGAVRRTLRAVSLLASPRDFLHRAPVHGFPRFFAHLEVEVDQREGEVRWRVALPEDAEPCRPLFAVLAGVARASTQAVGWPASRVEHAIEARRAVYRLRPPARPPGWGWIERLVQLVRNARAAVMELDRQRRELRDQRRALRAALEEANTAVEMRTRFLQSMGHELRTPVNGVLNSVRDLQVSDGASEDLVEQLGASAERLSAVVDAVLAYAQLAEGRVVIDPSAVRPVDLAKSIVDAARSLAAEREVSVLLVPGAGASGWWAVDHEHLRRIGVEALRNAVGFSPRGAEVEVRVGVDEASLRLELLDRGPGVPEARKESVFEPFVQHHTTEARGHGGSGLGLSIVRTVARGMGGDAVLLDRPGGGTVLRIEVAVSAVEAPRSPQARASNAARRVLIVDDDRINRAVASRMLRKLGCEVVQAEDGIEALRVLSEQSFGLVLMDCEMPNLDGWAATRRAREELGLDVPIVAATAYTAESDRRRCQEVGMDDFLSKPLDPRLLEAILDKWMANPNGSVA